MFEAYRIIWNHILSSINVVKLEWNLASKQIRIGSYTNIVIDVLLDLKMSESDFEQVKNKILWSNK